MELRGGLAPKFRRGGLCVSKIIWVKVDDLMQQGYFYALSAPMGEQFADDFRPDLSPRQMLKMGVFGGKYLADCRDEFPADWYEDAKLSPENSDPKLNYFGVAASYSPSCRIEKGWIHPDDPRGWFQWYCRYYLGRRHEDDARQIGRWREMRHQVGQIERDCKRGDLKCRPEQRQALLHWAYDSREL